MSREPEGGASSVSRSTTSARVSAALTAVALLPVAIVVITRTGRRYVPVGDIALIDLRVRDVWSRAIPLVGPYSRLGWNHPGPAMFWLIAPLSGLFGRPAWATLVGGVLIQGVAIIAVGRLAWRKGGLPLVAAALAVNGLAYGAMPPTTLLEAWNPNVTYPFLLVLLLQVWCIADGDIALLPFAAAVATFLVQTHVGYLPLVVVAVSYGLIGAIVRTLRGESLNRGWRRPILWSVAVVTGSWAPVALQEIVHQDNIRPLVRSLLGKDVTLGPRTAAGIFGSEFHVLPPWLGGHTRLDPLTATVVPASAAYVIIPIVLLVVAALAVRHNSRVRTPLALTALLFGVGLYSISRVVGGAQYYAFFWRVPIAILVVFVTFGALWFRFGFDRRSDLLRATVVLLAAIVVFSSVAGSVRIAQRGEVSTAEPLARTMLAHIQQEHEPTGSVLVRAPDVPFLGLERTVVNELDRSGATVRVDTDLGFQFGYTRTATPSQVDQVWYVVEKGQYLSVLAALPGARVLWATAALPAAQERELRVLQRRLYDELNAAHRMDRFDVVDSPLVGFGLEGIPGVDSAAASRVSDLNVEALRNAPCRCAIIAFPSAETPTVAFP
jgi:hypothetical protein